MKAWALKSPYDGHLIEVHGDEGRAMRSAVMHRIENGMDVKVVEVKVEEVKNAIKSSLPTLWKNKNRGYRRTH